MAVFRLLRCHPFVKGGYDPVVRESAAQEPPAQKTHSSAGGPWAVHACGFHGE